MKTVAIMGIAIALGAGGALAMKLASPPQAAEVDTTPVIDPSEAAPPSALPEDPRAMAIDNGLVADGPSVSTQPIVSDASVSHPPAAAGNQMVCGQSVPLMTDGRLMNHYPYAQASSAELVAPPAGFGGGNCALIHRDMAGPLARMIADAKKQNPAVGNALMGVSCYRSVARQTELFCRPDRIRSRGIAGQAKWVAPGGFSEHATGLTIDFGARTRPECHVSPCFKDTATGQWLAANAAKYGFELSFPAGNVQGVSFEPWHFRYIGSDSAKRVFGTARGAR